jgi:hypothetical protein
MPILTTEEGPSFHEAAEGFRIRGRPAFRYNLTDAGPTRIVREDGRGTMVEEMQ